MGVIFVFSVFSVVFLMFVLYRTNKGALIIGSTDRSTDRGTDRNANRNANRSALSLRSLLVHDPKGRIVFVL